MPCKFEIAPLLLLRAFEIEVEFDSVSTAFTGLSPSSLAIGLQPPDYLYQASFFSLCSVYTEVAEPMGFSKNPILFG